ncbi:MAG: hypothetical protein IPF74_14735 [Rhodocyclaceae bacterium]|nr:hypothetical protein [Rhodocyclaceae bacterium]
MLHCAILRSPHPHARVVKVDVRAAEALPGVLPCLPARMSDVGPIPPTPHRKVGAVTVSRWTRSASLASQWLLSRR